MRILHTADWHLGVRQYQQSGEIFKQVEHICGLTAEHNVDVLLVAGDIFDTKTSALPELAHRLTAILTPYIHQGLHVILMPGNHDDRNLFRLMKSLLSMESDEAGRVHIVQTREIFTIEGIQFAAIPYPTREILEPFRSDATGNTERNVALSSAYANLVRAVVGDLDPSLPSVFINHINVAGVTTPSEHELNYDSDLRLGRADLPLASNIAYIALGHIHQCQCIEHPIPCYYSGSIERLNWGEKNDDKKILLVDVPSTGHATVQELALQVTPFYELSLKSEDLPNIQEQYPDLEQAFVRIDVECQSDDDPVIVQRQVRKLCPRCDDVSLSGPGLGTQQVANSPANPNDYGATVLDYLNEVYADDPELSELGKRANLLLEEMNNAIAQN